jgi:RHS repeat-associated protein
VLVTVTDKKLAVDSNNDGWIDYYNPDVASANDYSSFGSQLVGRTFKQTGDSSYPYTFNGKLQDNDIGNQIQDYGMRIYNPLLGRFMSVDPLTHKYPELTPYQFASNTPLWAIDLDGKEAKTSLFPNAYAYLKSGLTVFGFAAQNLHTTLAMSIQVDLRASFIAAGSQTQGSIGLAADQYGSFAVEYGGASFHDLFSMFGGFSKDVFNTGNKEAQSNYLGYSLGFSGGLSDFWGEKHVEGLAGKFNEAQFSILSLSATLYNDMGGNLVGAGVSYSVGLPGAGFGSLVTNTKVFSFTLKDIDRYVDGTSKAQNTYNKYSNDKNYKNVRMSEGSITGNDGYTTNYTSVVGEDKKGQTITFSSDITLRYKPIKDDKGNTNGYQTDNSTVNDFKH